jgi:hypothetical protein
MDETSMKLWLPARCGYLQPPPGVPRRHCMEQEQRADLHKRRSCFSLIVFVADDMQVQQALPQVLVANANQLSARDYQMLADHQRTDSMFFLRRRSAWTDAPLLADILRLLAKCLESLLPHCHVLLSMDASPVHVTTKVIRAAALAGLHLHFIPAKMTPWLQPLDAYVFASLKVQVRREYEAALVASEIGEVNALQMCEIIAQSVEQVLQQKNWACAFRGCGFGGGTGARLGGRVGRRLAWPDAVPPITSDLPSLQQLQKIWVPNKNIPLGWLFHLCVRHDGSAETSAEPFALAPAAAAAPPNMWRGRLRSSSQQVLETQDSETAPAAPSSLATEAAASGSEPPGWPPAPPPPPPPRLPPELVPRLRRLGPPLPPRT